MEFVRTGPSIQPDDRSDDDDDQSESAGKNSNSGGWKIEKMSKKGYV